MLKLQKEMESHTYIPGRSICFAVTYPKIREIFAADFRDRVVHHLLINEIEPYFERRFIYDSYACRAGKGCHMAVKRLREFLSKISKNQTQNAFFAELDIESFFSNIDKEILIQIVENGINKFQPAFRKNDILWLAKTIIRHDPTTNFHLKGDPKLMKTIPPSKTLFKQLKTKGLPIGNLTSQFFANVYLNELDQFVKRILKVKYYIRYVDDLVLLSRDKNELKIWRKKIDKFLRNKLALQLHPAKDKYGSIYRGINFAGYIVKPNYLLSRKRVVGSLKTKLYYFNKGLLLISNNQAQLALPLSKPPCRGEIEAMQAMVNSYYGHFKHADCYKLRKNIYERHFGALREYLEPVGEYCSFRIIYE